MQAAAGYVGELEVEEDEEALPLCHLVMFVALRASEMSDPELNSDSTGVGALGCLCASASLLIRSSSVNEPVSAWRSEPEREYN
jgi:hypothetical protein